MRILLTSDLHYNIRRSQEPTREVARRACREGGDALVLLGDTAGADLGPFRDALNLFAEFKGAKFLVPGNHCLWCDGHQTSMERYRTLLPALAAEAGFDVLDHRPAVLGPVALVGSIGWYDYSFRREELGIPVEFYRAKVSPGAAAYLGMNELVAAHEKELSPQLMSMGVRWMDGQYIRLEESDEEFTEQLCKKLSAQLEEVPAAVERIIVGLHHVPFRELLPVGSPQKLEFAHAYMGSSRLGEVLKKFPRITHVYCGHSHWRSSMKVGGMKVISIGSTYIEKHLEVLDV